MKSRIVLVLVLFAVSCAPLPATTVKPSTLPPDTAVTSPPEGDMPTNKPYVNPFSPKPGDEKLTRSNIFIYEASLMIRESYPPQVSLSISGDLPTPCHQLRAEIAPPDAENKILVNVYSVVNPDLACTQVVKSFQEQIDLGTFPSGHYAVWVNSELAGEFDS